MHPSLWRQSQLIRHAGLFEVCERIYQVRNHDIANVTIIEGDGALIVMDPGTVAECTKVAMDLYFEHRPRLPVAAVIYTHTHIDHFGGVLGAVSPDDVAAGRDGGDRARRRLQQACLRRERHRRQRHGTAGRTSLRRSAAAVRHRVRLRRDRPRT